MSCTHCSAPHPLHHRSSTTHTHIQNIDLMLPFGWRPKTCTRQRKGHALISRPTLNTLCLNSKGTVSNEGCVRPVLLTPRIVPPVLLMSLFSTEE